MWPAMLIEDTHDEARSYPASGLAVPLALTPVPCQPGA